MVSSPVAEEDSSAKNSKASIPLQAEKKTSSQQPPLESLHGGVLYAALFDQNILSQLQVANFVKLEARFQEPYPSGDAAYKAVLLDRLGILKALDQQKSLRRAPAFAMTAALRILYSDILANPHENWLVKRQAFRNLKSALSAKERETYYATLESRVVSLATKSESEILEGALNESR